MPNVEPSNRYVCACACACVYPLLLVLMSSEGDQHIVLATISATLPPTSPIQHPCLSDLAITGELLCQLQGHTNKVHRQIDYLSQNKPSPISIPRTFLISQYTTHPPTWSLSVLIYLSFHQVYSCRLIGHTRAATGSADRTIKFWDLQKKGNGLIPRSNSPSVYWHILWFPVDS